jgi:signal transduction histidine kinase
VAARWVNRLLDKPYVATRLVILLLCTAGYLALLRPPTAPPTATDWAFALASIITELGGGAWPLPAALGQTALLLSADLLTGSFEHGPAVFVKVFATLAVMELAIRRPWRQAAVGSVALVLVYLVHIRDGLPDDLAPMLYRATVLVVVPVLLGAYVRATRELAKQAQQRADEQQQRRDMEILAVRAAERTAIARELHDLVAHHVASMVLRVNVARHVLPIPDARVAAVLDDLHSTGANALADLRRLVAVLRDPANLPDEPAAQLVDPQGLPAALYSVAEHAGQLGLRIHASIDPDVARLDPVRGLAVLRLLQEGLANVAKHAGPSAQASISIRMAETDAIHVLIFNKGGEPAGRAAGQATTAAPPGHGLIGMRERVELLGGQLRAGPTTEGWRLAATLPASTKPS